MHAATKPVVDRYREPPAYSIDMIEQCLAPSCAIRLEHAPRIAPHQCQWQDWQETRLHDGDARRICQDIERCRAAHGDHYIRLCIENFAFRSCFSVVVHDPCRDP